MDSFDGSTCLTIESFVLRIERSVCCSRWDDQFRCDDIIKVEVLPPEYSGHKKVDDGKILLWAGVDPIELGGNDTLERVEQEWLAYEIAMQLCVPLELNNTAPCQHTTC